ncbi:MAG: hypothetical protein CMG21_03160 [Candidatus Marinimicrobia bacterium]|mgnify:FL=1|nr:hypothetical protein [Candidatus Neomarinimicrobiota bacterium]
MLKKIILLIFIATLFSKSEIEEYIYDVEIKGISIIAGNVGKCSLKIEKKENNQYNMDIVTKTTNLAKILYPYVDEIKLKINDYFSLLSIEQKISNRDKKLDIKVDKKNKNIIRNGKKLNFYSDTLFSPYSLIHFLRKEKIELNNQYAYKIFDGRKIKDILLKVSKIEKVKVPYGTFECFNIKPISEENIIKNNGFLELWYTNNNEKIPVKIKLETNIGTFIMKLKKINKK